MIHGTKLVCDSSHDAVSEQFDGWVRERERETEGAIYRNPSFSPQNWLRDLWIDGKGGCGGFTSHDMLFFFFPIPKLVETYQLHRGLDDVVQKNEMNMTRELA
jgi:hypothetical protein